MSRIDDVFRPAEPAPTSTADFATVAEVAADGIRIRLDGEDTAGDKFYRRLASYESPVAGDRVHIIRLSGSILITGKVI